MTYSVYVNSKLILSQASWDKALEACASHCPAHVVLVADHVIIGQWKDGQAVPMGKFPFTPLD